MESYSVINRTELLVHVDFGWIFQRVKSSGEKVTNLVNFNKTFKNEKFTKVKID